MSGVFISLYLSQAVFLELSPSVCLSVFVCLSRLTTARLVSVYLKDCLSVCLSLSLTILSTCLHKSFSVAIGICQSLLLPFLVTMSVSICQPVNLFLSVCVPNSILSVGLLLECLSQCVYVYAYISTVCLLYSIFGNLLGCLV